ncbi:PIK3R3 [Cordylochernes scorpioides]|uniref:PIK3R3 n=1 Tax=Cordylochernes scorpioides TaxID=51811 RepID=A0ABY6KC05_9ARAC|nr:PIK3R3 [Cordylochernes scorpioides]
MCVVTEDRVDLSSYEVNCIASTLKKYLRELPNPVIPVEFYNRFIEASRQPREEACVVSLRHLVAQLPVAHRSTLQTLMAHWCRVCQLQQGRAEPPAVLTQALCHVLLRPSWDNILQMVHNTEAHLRIVELLLLRGDWGEQLPDFGTTAPVVQLVSVYRKGGSNKLIKIYQSNGKYGFALPLRYNSVVELINCHLNTSLRQYNRTLDVKLLYPVSRFHQGEEEVGDVEAVTQKLMAVNCNYQVRSRLYDQHYEELSKLQQEIELKKHAQDAFRETLIILQEQILANTQLKKEALPHEMEAWLLSKGVKKERINSLLQDSSAQVRDVGRETFLQSGSDHLPHHNPSTWLLADCSRQRAQELLAGKPDGTFLIRKSTKVNQYALSIVADGEIGHCLIEETGEGYFGFAEPYNIHPDLKSLVLHYAHTSLEEHNDKLRTTLAYPVYAQDAYIFLQS